MMEDGKQPTYLVCDALVVRRAVGPSFLFLSFITSHTLASQAASGVSVFDGAGSGAAPHGVGRVSGVDTVEHDLLLQLLS